MGAFKQLNQQDAFVTTYNAQKRWTIPSASFETSGIEVFFAESGSGGTYLVSPDDTQISALSGKSYNTKLAYRAINQLFYEPFQKNAQELLHSSSYEFYPQSSFIQGSRTLKSSAIIFSVPQHMFGTNIVPGTFTLGSDGDEYILNQDDYVIPIYIYTGKIYDDGEGRVVFPIDGADDLVVGNIFYAQGLVVLTNPVVATSFRFNPRTDVSWTSNHPIYTYNYHCKFSDYEFNNTQNPTAVTGSDSTYKDFATGSSFQPYITTVGLYNDSSELVAVAKLSKPVPKPANTEMTIQIKLDI